MDDADVLALALSLPGAWVDSPWEDHEVAKVGRPPGKVFAFPGGGAVSLKGRPEDLDELRAAYPTAVGKAPYLSARHWVRVTLDGTLPGPEVADLVRASYDAVVSALPRSQRP